MSKALGVFHGAEQFLKMKEAIKDHCHTLAVTGITDGARAYFIAETVAEESGRALVLAHNMLDARSLRRDLEFLLGEDRVALFPSKDYIYHNIEANNGDMVHDRIRVLSRIQGEKNLVVVTTADAVMQYTLPPEDYSRYTLRLRPGDRVNLEQLSGQLVVMGYKMAAAVEGPGQASIRGGILDLFSPNMENPIRIELFDDEIDTIRTFDPLTQLSKVHIQQVEIVCSRELVYTKEEAEAAAKKLEAYPGFETDVEYFRQRHYFPAADKYLPLLQPRIKSVVDYFSKDDFLFLDYPARMEESGEKVMEDQAAMLTSLLEKEMLPALFGDYLLPMKQIIERKDLIKIAVGGIATSSKSFHPEQSFALEVRSVQSYQGKIKLLVDDIVYWHEKKYAITIFTGSKMKAEAFFKTLNDNEIDAVISEENRLAQQGEIVICDGNIEQGFEFPLLGRMILSARELYGARGKGRRTASMPGVKIKSYNDLSIGDYVVHQVHGIGRYLGLQRIEVDQVTKDYMKIEYRDGDILYVPASALNTINKYIGNEIKELRLNKMGGSDFARVKNKVKKSVEDLANRLVALYAARETEEGFAFSKDNDWQKQFEDEFPYEETQDQLQAISEMKQDMESNRPMDRLLCGDVGFGKTEVAIRGAFKAVMDSKQVAYLVPTTILAQQHYNTFVQRMKDYPINIEMLSRFKNAKQQKEIVKKVKSGQIDILIGTHRILQKDVIFRDLGFLIIDEEQRFGVKDKEKIKELKHNIDVLTLSATPIPRTLHMSLVGIRDMSLIANPPEDRYPVQTFILEYDKNIVCDAIRKELGRGGQVYYIYNRVEGIHRVAAQLQEAIPQANIAVGHGQMNERELEDIMLRTQNGEIDILVCTTIVETGLDISNINTIIIENADRMGLAQLYQLRGRVGRSNRLAYAYLTYRKDRALNETAVKRLNAIREFTEFGSGFKIAMRDLEIRGAGDMLGGAQHGAMDSVGYDMYCRLLEEAVHKAKGQEEPEPLNTTVDLKTDAFIPEKYIDSHNTRLEIYKRIAIIENDQDLEEVTDELIDRFGEPPQSVLNLMEISVIRTLGCSCGLEEIIQKGDDIHLYYAHPEAVDYNAVMELGRQFAGFLFYRGEKRPHLVYKARGLKPQQILANIKILLHSYRTIALSENM